MRQKRKFLFKSSSYLFVSDWPARQVTNYFLFTLNNRLVYQSKDGSMEVTSQGARASWQVLFIKKNQSKRSFLFVILQLLT